MTPCEELTDGGPPGLPEARDPRLPQGAPAREAGGRLKRRVRKRGTAPHERRAARREAPRVRKGACTEVTVAPLGAPSPLAFRGGDKPSGPARARTPIGKLKDFSCPENGGVCLK